MNINPDKVKELVLLFSELDDDYQKGIDGQSVWIIVKTNSKELD